MPVKPTIRVLYTSAEVRSAIIGLFRDGSGERIAIAAYVGDGADSYLPSPKGLRLICSPTPGATNPDALRLLMSRGTRVEFVDSLHMKVYWAKAKGAVVTSANLSTNAMGVGGLKEAGVLLGPGQFDVEQLLKQLKPRPATGRDLHRLDQEHKRFHSTMGWGAKKSALHSYREWFEARARPRWKIFLYSEEWEGLSEEATKSIQREYGRPLPRDWIWSKHRTVKELDWILCGHISRGKLQKLSWLFADRVFSVQRSDPEYKLGFPNEVVQIHDLKRYPPPPFSANQKLCAAMGQVLEGRIRDESESPSPYELGRGEIQNIFENLNRGSSVHGASPNRALCEIAGSKIYRSVLLRHITC